MSGEEAKYHRTSCFARSVPLRLAHSIVENMFPHFREPRAASKVPYDPQPHIQRATIKIRLRVGKPKFLQQAVEFIERAEGDRDFSLLAVPGARLHPNVDRGRQQVRQRRALHPWRGH